MEDLKRVVFLDRDGVINRDSPDYIKDWSEFKFLPGSIEAIKDLTLNGFAIIIITNQSAINRKLISEDTLKKIHDRMNSIINAHGGKINKIFSCPHIPEDRCNCRKPKPGLIYEAQKRFLIDLSASSFIGDSSRDIECAKKAGCRHAVLVKTGNGTKAEKELSEKKIVPDWVAENLYEAASWIIANH
ncbi:MAG: D-glycero-beta-D-manno-heptose-1,7-bisphosphate 7-phosphatase [Deltaproteobacteria bacterium]|nr:MAG: D-glycero-beta-D-manno-heptose-1,7-bisphosphate 7-phosphatase [Deltaproteobacteria bacterium]